MSRLPTDRRDAGFTIIEVLIALAIVTFVLVSIGSVMSTNARGVQTLENHVALVQTAQTVLTTAIPQRKDLAPGRLSGRMNDYRWQVDVGPVADGSVANDTEASWIPELIKVRVQSPSGAAIVLETVRLMKRPRQ